MDFLKKTETTWFQKSIYRFKRITGIGVYPDFLVLGGQKCGTTSLFASLVQHPDIYRPRKKEPMYFSFRRHRHLAWYRANFASIPYKIMRRLTGKHFYTFDASTCYLFHPLAAEHAHRTLPRAKLVALLREPSARAYSHYQFMRRLGVEKLSFDKALAAEEQRLAGASKKLLADSAFNANDYRFYSYKARGHYAEQLEAWMKHFPREQLLVLQTEAYLRDPKGTLERVLDFLQIPPCDQIVHEKANVGGYTESMSDAARESLRAYFKPHNERLWKWLGEEWDWDAKG